MTIAQTEVATCEQSGLTDCGCFYCVSIRTIPPLEPAMSQNSAPNEAEKSGT